MSTIIKKPLGLGLLIGLLATAFVALPATASAAELTDESGATVATGTTISATSVNAVTTITPKGLLTCEHVEVHGSLQ